MSKLSLIFFLIFASCFMYFINMPLRLDIFICIFMVTLYKLLFRKVLLHFTTGYLKFDSSDFLVYSLMLVMSTFIISIGFIINPLLACAMEGLVTSLSLGNLTTIQGFIKLPNGIVNLFALSDVNSSTGNNSSPLASEHTATSQQSADIAEKNVLVRRLYSVNPTDSHMNIH